MDLLWLAVSWIIFILCGLFLYEWLKKPRSIKGKHVVVTGGSSGIGKSVAISAAKRGAHVTILARDAKRLEEATQEISKQVADQSQQIQHVSIDISKDFSSVEKALSTLEEEVGPVYMLINCAGAAVCGKLEDVSSTEIQNQFSLNVLGTIYSTKAIISKMKSRGEGIVVITGSVSSILGIYGMSIYSSTKFALRGFAEALHMETKPYGITVTLALPPDTDTPGLANENKTKPLETRLISESAGLFHPDVVAEQMMADSLRGHFLSYVGFESCIAATVCAGMSPPSSFKSLALEALLMSPLRLVSAGYSMHFAAIIRKCKHNRNKNKKLE